MDVEQMATQARKMVADGTAPTLTIAVRRVVQATLYRIAGTYTVQAENYWCACVLNTAKIAN